MKKQYIIELNGNKIAVKASSYENAMKKAKCYEKLFIVLGIIAIIAIFAMFCMTDDCCAYCR